MDNLSAHNASEYDAQVRHTIPHYELIQQEVLALVRAVTPSPSCWIDAGCGTGSLVGSALALFPETRFILADPSPAMLAQARGRLAGTHSGRITFLPPVGTSDLGRLLPPAAAQVITAIQCHHYLDLEGRRQALVRCYGLLEERGVLVAFENVAPRTPDGVRIGLTRWREFLVREGWSKENAVAHGARYGQHYHPITVEEHLALLNLVGFSTVEVLWYCGLQAGFYAIK